MVEAKEGCAIRMYLKAEREYNEICMSNIEAVIPSPSLHRHMARQYDRISSASERHAIISFTSLTLKQ